MTPLQDKVLELFAKNKYLSETFYLTGGTALATFYLKHRYSDDIDFFSEKDFDNIAIEKFMLELKEKFKANELIYNKIHDRRIFYLKFPKEELKVEFTLYPFGPLKKFDLRNQIKIDSLQDIAANKLMALYDRFEPKDYFDLYFLLQKFDLDDLIKNVEKKFGMKLEKIALGSAFARAGRLGQTDQPLPKLLKKISVEKIKDFYIELARNFGQALLR